MRAGGCTSVEPFMRQPDLGVAKTTPHHVQQNVGPVSCHYTRTGLTFTIMHLEFLEACTVGCNVETNCERLAQKRP